MRVPTTTPADTAAPVVSTAPPSPEVTPDGVSVVVVTEGPAVVDGAAVVVPGGRVKPQSVALSTVVPARYTPQASTTTSTSTTRTPGTMA